MEGVSESCTQEVGGKWILTGEHAVLRGCPALVFPLKSRTMKFVFTPGASALEFKVVGESAETLEKLLQVLINEASRLLDKKFEKETAGVLSVSNSIPLGAGLGASAALCTNFSKWFCDLGLIPKERTFDFAKSLEDKFHGTSSGVDIAVCVEGCGLRFQTNGKREKLDQKWTPNWWLIHSGKVSLTSQAVAKVQRLASENPEKAEKIDQQMREASEIAEVSLNMDESEGLLQMIRAIDLAESCFREWGLIPEPLDHLIERLRESGAVAIKPTGSGEGGYLLTLWKEDPPENWKKQMISAY